MNPSENLRDILGFDPETGERIEQHHIELSPPVVGREIQNAFKEFIAEQRKIEIEKGILTILPEHLLEITRHIDGGVQREFYMELPQGGFFNYAVAIIDKTQDDKFSKRFCLSSEYGQEFLIVLWDTEGISILNRRADKQGISRACLNIRYDERGNLLVAHEAASANTGFIFFKHIKTQFFPDLTKVFTKGSDIIGRIGDPFAQKYTLDSDLGLLKVEKYGLYPQNKSLELEEKEKKCEYSVPLRIDMEEFKNATFPDPLLQNLQRKDNQFDAWRQFNLGKINVMWDNQLLKSF